MRAHELATVQRAILDDNIHFIISQSHPKLV